MGDDAVKIIFLDMDGVLCTNRAHIAQGVRGMPGHHPFMDALDIEGVGMLNRIHEKFPDTRYVLSSTWRRFHSKEEIENHLGGYSFTGIFHDDWKTDELGPIRGNEIQRWLDNHNGSWTNYIILDDNSDMLETQKYHFVQTDSYDGISSRNYWRMETVFSNEVVH